MEMQRVLLIICVLAVSVGSWGQSANDSNSGNHLLQVCLPEVRSLDNPSLPQNASELFNEGYCLGFVEGVAEASHSVCLPTGVQPRQAVRIVVKFLQDHPEKLNLYGAILADTALSQAFPCSR
jgi:hypothetical protein